MSDLPRYVHRFTYKNRRIGYRFIPPQKYIDAGIAERRTFGAQIHRIRDWLAPVYKAMDKFDEDNRVANLKSTSRVSHLIEHYKFYSNFKDLADTTVRDYEYMFGFMTKHTKDCAIDSIDVSKARMFYEEVRDAHGLHVSSKFVRVSRIVFNHALDLDLIPNNPFSRVKAKTPKPRRVLWTDEQVKQFLTTAYNNWEWRSIGLICQMGYAWVQRVNDLRLLTWDCLDLSNKKTVTISQSKRGATVYLPIADDLHEMLLQQEQDFGFQDYVAPRVYPQGGQFYPYSREDVSRIAKDILKAAGLPTNLWLSDLRRTGTTQMVENGVPVTSIMQVTGHSDPSALSPYIKNTLRGATEALKARQGV